MNLLFVSNLFPSEDEPYRGLDNATLLPHLRRFGVESIRVLTLRPTLNPRRWGERHDLQPRPCDKSLNPRYVGVPYAPKIGSNLNHILLRKAASPALSRIHRESPIDAVLVSWLFPDGCGIGAWCAENAIPYVMICQGSDAHAYLEIPARRRHILDAITKSKAVITRSADLAERLRKAGAESEKLHPVYNGIDTEIFRAGDPSEARAELGLPAEGSILLFVGNFLPVKNPIFLVEAWREITRSRKCSLVMIGSGPLEPAIREAAGDAPGLILPGRLSAEDVAKYMRAADALCLTSHGEGVPNVVLEAFGCGLPVVSADVGGISEVIDREFLGRMVSPGDKTGYVAALASHLGEIRDRERISTFSRRYSWDVTAATYSAILGIEKKSDTGNG